MLEVKNLRKEYRTKNGVVTKALDDVSLTFPETGMIFILGKSGSGKSTLLNVCGGLDKMDSGEIVIKGKSSKEFSGQDFDSYRNTYVGFVFQDYNILDEFTVYDNIALALELQNKKRDRETIEQILSDVEMSQFGNRKPNTLSGGQKQRVAIARALVKNPEIIMADEPTGALDSKTGQQVFDTLKKLSEKKLVLVVSHDRDFAEQYGDRIIELKDGKILSDMTRAVGTEKDRNVRFFGTDTVCVTDGAKITDADLLSIKNFLVKSGGGAIISTSRERISEVKSTLPEIQMGAFEALKAQPVSKSYPKQKLIRSKFALKHAFKMGASGLKSKPIRLAFTMLLSIFAFVLFGLASTIMTFDRREITASTLTKSNYEHITLKKEYYLTEKNNDGVNSYEYERTERTNYTQAELKEFAAKYPGAIGAIGADLYINEFDLSENARQFYPEKLSGVVPADGLTIDSGKKPVAADEIVISDYIFDMLKAGSIRSFDPQTGKQTETKINSHSDIIGKKLDIRGNYGGKTLTLKVVGIYKGASVPITFTELKNAADSKQALTGEERWKIKEDWRQERDGGLFAYIGASDAFIAANKSTFGSSKSNENLFEYGNFDIVNADGAPSYNIGSTRFVTLTAGKPSKIKACDLNGAALTSLSGDKIAISAKELGGLYSNLFRNSDPNYENAELQEFRNKANWLEFGEKSIPSADQTKEPTSEALSQEDTFKYIKELSDKVKTMGLTIPKLKIKSRNDGSEKELEVVGAYYWTKDRDKAGICVSDELAEAIRDKNMYRAEITTKYVEPEDAIIGCIFVPFSDKSREKALELVELTLKRNDDDSTVTIANAVAVNIAMAANIAKDLGTAFIWIGAVLALFAFLMMFNFISASITSKKKDIGILRAIGARTTDVYKIFLSESFIVAFISFVISTIGSALLCSVVNDTIMGTSLQIALFVFGPISILAILGVTIVSMILSTVIPVAMYSKKPPIESIRAL